MKISFYAIFLVLTVPFFEYLYPMEAVILTPVKEFSSKKLSEYSGLSSEEFKKQVNRIYAEFPLSGYGAGDFGCVRGTQGLFNGRVSIVEEDDETDEICVEFKHWIIVQDGERRHPRYWSSRQHVSTLLGLREEVNKDEWPVFPSTEKNENNVVLLFPWKDKERDVLYSAGTRFMRLEENDEKGFCQIALYAPELNKVVKKLIPVEYCMPDIKDLGDKERLRLFVKILGLWKGIQFAWGGCSHFGLRDKEEQEVEVVEGEFLGKNIQYWRHKKGSILPFGFDTSSLIAFVLQMCDIPYFYKTTKSAFVLGDKIKNYDDVQNGYLIVREGLISVISDKEKGMIMHTTGYISWRGKLVEEHISKTYKNVKDIKDLLEKINKGERFQVLDRDGNDYKNLQVACRIIYPK